MTIGTIGTIRAGRQTPFVVELRTVVIIIKARVVVVVAVSAPPVVVPAAVLIVFHRRLGPVVTDTIIGPLATVVANISIWLLHDGSHNDRFLEDDFARPGIYFRDFELDAFIVFQVVAPRSLTLEF